MGVYVIVAFIAATHLFACIAGPDPRGLQMLRYRAVQYLGTISYSFYLMHPLAMFAVKKLVLHWMPEGHGSWVATMAFAIASVRGSTLSSIFRSFSVSAMSQSV